MEVAEDLERPNRARPPRAEAETTQRRRRRGLLDVMGQSRLNFFAPGQLDLDNFVYRWVNDSSGRVRQLTRQDDYDFVTTDELGADFDSSQTDSESTERVRMIVGRQADGSAEYAYLLKKPRAFWEADNDEIVRHREDMMAGRVYRNEANADAGVPNVSEDRPGGADNFYAARDNTLASAAQRRRGPVPRTLK